VKALDAGPMLAIAEAPIGADDTSEEVERRLASLGAGLLVSTLDRMTAGDVDETPQDHTRATYAHRLTKDDGRVDWSRPAADLHNQIRGLHPWPHAFSYLEGQRLILLRSTWRPDVTGAEPGTVITAHGDELRIAAGRGAILITELQAEGRRASRTREFLAGHPIAPGRVFRAEP
jgi:methionyl-tRNA formyltransferase